MSTTGGRAAAITRYQLQKNPTAIHWVFFPADAEYAGCQRKIRFVEHFRRQKKKKIFSFPADAEHAGRQGDGECKQYQHEQQQEQHVRRGGGAWFFFNYSQFLPLFTLFQVIVTEEEVGDFLVQCYAQKEKENNLAIGEQ